MSETAAEVVRKLEREYTSGKVTQSKYVDFDMFETINRIEAYINSKHMTGETDSLGREKPFFNITRAAANIWFRATDIDRKHIRVRATKSKDWIDSFLATVLLHAWMRRAKFGKYLNQWGKTLARFGSAVTKFVENASGLHISVIPWTRLICDPVDFANNPKIEPLDLTESQLWERVQTMGYSRDAVQGLMDAITTRETLDKRKKDNRPGYIRAYEIHAVLSRATLKRAQNVKADEISKDDETTFVQQVHVLAFVGKKEGRKTTYDDFTLYAGEESKDPYRKDDLIEEDDRTLAVGSVENLFDAQWMTNHAVKNEKDTLDIATRLLFQTADGNFLNMNVVDNMESGDVLIHAPNMPLTQVNTAKYDVSQMMNFRQSWRQVGNEINGISEAMLGIQSKSGTAWRQTEATLGESYSLFEIMTENKALALEDMLRERILPYIKENQLDTAEEVVAILESHDIERIDSIYFKNEAIKRTNRAIASGIEENLSRIANGEPVVPIEASEIFSQNLQAMQEGAALLGNTRYFKPSELDTRTWKEQLENLEWDAEVDITGENADTQGMLETLNTALKLIVAPGFEQNRKAQAIVRRVLELTGAMSPIEYDSLPSNSAPQPTRGATDSIEPDAPRAPGIQAKERNIA